MGNANSTQPSKSQKERKKEGHGRCRGSSSFRGEERTTNGARKSVLCSFSLSRSADTAKNKQPTTHVNGKTTANQREISQRDYYDKHHVGIRTTNPFLIFFLRLRSKKPKEHVTVIARAAGKLWARMTPEQRKKYIDLANAEKKRREERRQKRKRSSGQSSRTK